MSALSFRTFTLVNVVEEFLLQHPLEIFSHFPSLTLDRANFLADRNRPLAILVSNSGKSAVGPAEYRPTLSNRPSSTSCFLSVPNVHESWRVLRCCDCLLPANQPQRVFLTAMSPASSCSSHISFFHAQILAHHHHQLTPSASDTSGTQCALPTFHNSRISGIHQLDACTGWSCKKCLHMINCILYASMHDRVLSFLVLHVVNLDLRSTGIE